MANDQVISLKRPVQVPPVDGRSIEKPKYPSEYIPLPTKGYFYPPNSPLASGEVEIKVMTAFEEDILSNQNLIRSGKVLDKLLESLLIDKSISPADILVADKNAIFIGIRRLAYGDKYNVSITCPQCDVKNAIEIDLAAIGTRPFNFDACQKGINSFPFKLPSGIQIEHKLLCQADEKAIESELAALKKQSKEISRELTTRLIYLITSVDGDTDKQHIRSFVTDRLTAKDSLELRKHLKENTPDVDMTFDFECVECGYEKRLVVPIGASFLWPDIDAG